MASSPSLAVMPVALACLLLACCTFGNACFWPLWSHGYPQLLLPSLGFSVEQQLVEWMATVMYPAGAKEGLPSLSVAIINSRQMNLFLVLTSKN